LIRTRAPFPFAQVDLRFSGLVEAWAAGAGWFEVCRDTSLDEGDLARLLGRTADLLRQIIFIAHVLPGVKDNAKAALRSMNRSPISELVS
jgi:superfamily II RNA helicase